MVLSVSLALALGGCGEAGELGVALELAAAAAPSEGPLERCLEVRPTEAPLTLDRVRFEARDGRVAPRRRAWTDVALTSGRAFCVPVCACTGDDEVGRFVVEDDGRRAAVEVSWPEDYCCEPPGRGDGGVRAGASTIISGSMRPSLARGSTSTSRGSVAGWVNTSR